MSYPIVAIVGRPNVGKSTLFNRLLRRRASITSDIPGTTRDSQSGFTSYRDQGFILVDTAGIESSVSEDQVIELTAQQQARLAMTHADLVVYLVDVRSPITPMDYTVAKMLYKTDLPVILVAHKADNPSLMDEKSAFYELGFGEPISVSSIQNIGTDTLLEAICSSIPKKLPVTDTSLKISLIGRPNVGKSSIVNAITNSASAIVSNIPGTTLDSKDVSMRYKHRNITFIDTAGLRRRGKILPGIEKYSSLRTLSSINRSDITILVTDVSQGITKQDLHIAGLCKDSHTGLIIIANKWDLILDKDEFTINRYIRRYQKAFDFLPYAPLIFTSAETGQRLKNILEIALGIDKERQKRISTPELNRFLKQVICHQPPSSSRRSKGEPKLLYMSQTGVNPPCFTIVSRRSDNVHFSYIRYIENHLRKKYGFQGTGINLRFAESKTKD